MQAPRIWAAGRDSGCSDTRAPYHDREFAETHPDEKIPPFGKDLDFSGVTRLGKSVERYLPGDWLRDSPPESELTDIDWILYEDPERLP